MFHNQIGKREMSKTTLIWLRFLIPVVLLFFILVPLVQPNLDLANYLKISISTDSALYVLLVIVVGGIYYILNLREYAIKPSIWAIQRNIKTKLLAPFAKDPAIKKLEPELRAGHFLLNTFYGFVDEDKSLTEKSKSIHLNGLVMSTVADIRVLSLLATLIYLCGYLISNKIEHFEFAIGCFLLSGLTYFLMPRVIQRHIHLSNIQLEYIVTKYRKELKNSLLKIKG